MNRPRSFKFRLQATAGIALATAAVYSASLAFVAGADTQAPDTKAPETKAADSKAKDATAKEAKPEKKPENRKLTGAELYAINCNRCHPERYATEWTAPQWKTLMLHMRVRANLPAAQAKEILKYLQEDSGN
jgi:cytochrome c5